MPVEAVNGVHHTRSLGVSAEGLPDQYADGKAAKVWEYYIGSKQSRTSQYKQWICNLLRDNNCHTVLDVACGTGVDSIPLLEEGFSVVSTDASDKMLKHALRKRWERRHEEAFDKWVIEEANWLSLAEELEDVSTPTGGFDAVICLGNSFAHLPDFSGTQETHRQAITSFRDVLKPGGILMIDHRNFDCILDTGTVPAKNIYYSSDHTVDIKTSNLYVNGKPTQVTLDYEMDMSGVESKDSSMKNLGTHRFRLSYYPHRLSTFSKLLGSVFGDKSKHTVYGDFLPVKEISTPAYYVHVIEKPDHES